MPQHLIVVGGSYVGLEFAQIFRVWRGVTVAERALLGWCRARTRRSRRDHAASLRVSSGSCCRCPRSGRVARSRAASNRLADGAGVFEIEGSHLLLATGRRPNTGDLGVDAAGVDHATEPVTSSSMMNCAPTFRASGLSATATAAERLRIPRTTISKSSPRIFSMATRGGSATASRRMLYSSIRRLGRVGMTEREARAGGHRVRIGTRPMTRVGRAVEKGETLGFMKSSSIRRAMKFLERRSLAHRVMKPSRLSPLRCTQARPTRRYRGRC